MPRWQPSVVASLEQSRLDRIEMVERAQQIPLHAPEPVYRPVMSTNFYPAWWGDVATTAISSLGNAFNTFATSITTTASTTNAFYYAMDNLQTGSGVTYIGTPAFTTAPITDEQRAVWTAVRRKTELERGRAIRRGRKLLMQLLDGEQLASYARTGTFVVTGQTGTKYRLRKGRTIHELSACGDVIASLCVHLQHQYIAEDNLIAQMMLLQHDEEGIRALANITAMAPGIVRGLPSYRASDGGVLLRQAA